ncbi:DUF1254 domain-containing protein [Roseovarius sp. S4756]|uniref:DUF1254 domain-containing protein n=1 Tax=Roseovarius maritimus TaxID=3342637 RepID=UPI00372699F8
MNRLTIKGALALLVGGATGMTAGSASLAQNTATYSADVPAKITTPDSTDTRIGTLNFKDGAPDEKTVELVYDNLDFMRGVQAFLTGVSATSIRAVCNGFDSIGIKANEAFGITEDLMDARSLFLTPNTTTVYGFTCFDLSEGPMVMEVPTGVLGPVDDADFRWVNDIGVTGPDAGKGGKYLFVPPGNTDAMPETGYFVQEPRTNTLLLFFRAFVKDGDIAAAVEHVKSSTKVYPLTAVDNPPATNFVNASGQQFNTISANDFSFYEELNEVVQAEPADWVDPATVGLYASIGIRKGQDFAPDERMEKILTEAAAVGNATARSFLFASREPSANFYEDRQWFTPFIGGSYLFQDGPERLMDAATMFFYGYTGITPAMALQKAGAGSVYAMTVRDSDGAYLDGTKTYKVTLPGPIPAKDFWSFVVYDNQTRSLLETDQKMAGVDSNDTAMIVDADGTAEIWFAPEAPEGQEANWVQTIPGKGYNVLFRLYGPLEPWFDKSWKVGDLEPVQK